MLQSDPLGMDWKYQKYTSTVTIQIQNPPSLRFIRNVSHTPLDFVVNIGGIIGLFFGASIISLAEMVYIWTLRKC